MHASAAVFHGSRLGGGCWSCRLSSCPSGACRGKTRWWRKAPLELSHSSRSLLAGQRSFYLFCDGSAAKEQWFNAMQWGAADCGGAARAVEEMYRTFCHSIRQSKGVTYPQVGAPCVPGS